MGKIDVQNLDTESMSNAVGKNIETDDAFDGVGKEAGLQIWRIEKFKVVPWPKEEYGKFYSGDSYIVLKTTKSKDGDKLDYDIHFWLGSDTSQDEAGTAAYKTVELDESLNGHAVQHREVEGSESKDFLKSFTSFTVQNGGMESGFNHVQPEDYRARLLHVSGVFNSMSVREVPLKASSMNSSDVFILDKGDTIYQFCGKKCNPFERTKAVMISENMEAERAGKSKVQVVEEGSAPDEFWEILGGKEEMGEESRSAEDSRLKSENKKMVRISDEGGSLEFKECDGFTRENLDSNDVFLIDAGWEAFVWIGKNASHQEKGHAMTYAEKYLKQHDRPSTLPVSVVQDEHERPLFNELLSGN